MSDDRVSALVLSVGEPTTKRALDAISAQSHPCTETVLVENVSPFHRAMNEGIGKITTEYFLQCDADMVPDPDCVEVLLAHAEPETGVVIAHLHDTLLGKIQAIKLFVRNVPAVSVSPTKYHPIPTTYPALQTMDSGMYSPGGKSHDMTTTPTCWAYMIPSTLSCTPSKNSGWKVPNGGTQEFFRASIQSPPPGKE